MTNKRIKIGEEFVSRITGEKIIRTSEHKYYDELTPEDNLPNIFLIDRNLQIRKEIYNTKIALKTIWNFNSNLIDKVAEYFTSTDESNYFLDIYDSERDLNSAWEIYCENKDIFESNPFINQ